MSAVRHDVCVQLLYALSLLLLLAANVDAQEASTSPWSIHAQTTCKVQTHGTFRAPYEGTNSFENRNEGRSSFTGTLFLGRRLWRGVDLYVNPEAIAGAGLSRVLGLAGPPNGETYRVDSQRFRITLVESVPPKDVEPRRRRGADRRRTQSGRKHHDA